MGSSSSSGSGHPAPATDRSLEGLLIDDRFRLGRPIARGASGVIFLARDEAMAGVTCALKIVDQRTDIPRVKERFEREIRVATRLNSPFIVEIRGSGTLKDGRPYIAMEFLEGDTVDAALETGAFAPARAVSVAMGVLAGLAEAHRHDLVHRDLKAANVFLITGPGGREQAKVLDFGLVKELGPDAGPELTAQGSLVGTPSYMAPEQFRRSGVDHRTDLYAVGCLLYNMLAGRPPFRGSDPVPQAIRSMPTLGRLAWLHMKAPLPPLKGLSDPLWQAIQRLMAKALDDRFPDAAAAGLALQMCPEAEGAASMDLLEDPFAPTARMDPESVQAVLAASRPIEQVRAPLSAPDPDVTEEHLDLEAPRDPSTTSMERSRVQVLELPRGAFEAPVRQSAPEPAALSSGGRVGGWALALTVAAVAVVASLLFWMGEG